MVFVSNWPCSVISHDPWNQVSAKLKDSYKYYYCNNKWIDNINITSSHKKIRLNKWIWWILGIQHILPAIRWFLQCIHYDMCLYESLQFRLDLCFSSPSFWIMKNGNYCLVINELLVEYWSIFLITYTFWIGRYFVHFFRFIKWRKSTSLM